MKKACIKIRRSKMVLFIYNVLFYILSLLPKKKVVIFESFHGKQYSDNPRAIYEYMLENEVDYTMYWSIDKRYKKAIVNKDIKSIYRFSLRWLMLTPRAKYWVTNSRLPMFMRKSRSTTYLQTWHGTPLKKLATDMKMVQMPGTDTVKYKRNFLRESRKWDYLVSPNAYSTKIFKRAFNFNKEIIESGYPRNDYLINNNNANMITSIKKKSSIPFNRKVILYAPTWRDNQYYDIGKYKFKIQMDLDKMMSNLGDNYIILLRLHYLVAENLDLSAYKGFVYDCSRHDDIRELYLISDLLITDYSSVFFDYANLKRPMLFYVYDIDDYRDNLRGFYFDLEKEAPGPLVKTTDGLIKEIIKNEKYGFTPSQKTERFYEEFCSLENGSASKRVVEHVFEGK